MSKLILPSQLSDGDEIHDAVLAIEKRDIEVLAEEALSFAERGFYAKAVTVQWQMIVALSKTLLHYIKINKMLGG